MNIEWSIKDYKDKKISAVYGMNEEGKIHIGLIKWGDNKKAAIRSIKNHLRKKFEE